MRFYTNQHRYYCGIDLHARTMYLCILDQAGEIVLHRNLRSEPEAFLKALEPYRPDVAVAVECIEQAQRSRSARLRRVRCGGWLGVIQPQLGTRFTSNQERRTKEHAADKRAN